MKFPLTKEQGDLQERVRTLADGEFRERAAGWDEREEYPWENVKTLVKEGLMGMAIPREYGGQGRTLLDVILAIEAVARTCGITGRLLVDSNLGPVGAIVHYGSEAQKTKYLPRVVQGDKPAIAITEHRAGSAASDMETTITPDGDGWVLDGSKRWITGAGVSQTYVVFGRLGGIPGAAGIGAVIAEAGMTGLSVVKREKAMGMRGIPEGEMVFTRCRLPGANLLLPAGGFKKLMAAYNGQRLERPPSRSGWPRGRSSLPWRTRARVSSSGAPSAVSRGCAGWWRTWVCRSRRCAR